MNVFYNESLAKELLEAEAMDALIRQIESNPHVLYDLTVEQLEKVGEYYDEKIRELDIKLQRLKGNAVSG